MQWFRRDFISIRLFSLLMAGSSASAASPEDLLKPAFMNQFQSLLSDQVSMVEVMRRILRKRTLSIESTISETSCAGLLHGETGDEIFDLYSRLKEPRLQAFAAEW